MIILCKQSVTSAERVVNSGQFMFKEIYEYGVELDLIYVNRRQKCPIWGFLLTPHACDI